VPAWLRRYPDASRSEAPCPNGNYRGRKPSADFPQHISNPLLFGGTDIRERPSGFEHLPDNFYRAALRELGLCSRR